MIPIIQHIFAFFIGSFLVYISIPVIVRLSAIKHLYDEPNERRLNKVVVPNLGGVAIFLGITVSTLLSVYQNQFPDFRYILAAMIILFFIGIKDDILMISPLKKFTAQTICAIILIVPGNFRFTSLHGILGIYELNYFTSFLFSLLAIVAIINALNLIDGIDGLSSSIGILVSVAYGAFFFAFGKYNYSILCFATTGSLISFFLFNVFGKQNKIFMGDTGSLIVGLIIAALTIKLNEFSLNSGIQTNGFMPVFTLSVLALPVFDMLRLFTARLLEKKSPFHPDINHIHHKLLKIGYSHGQTTSILIGANLIVILLIYSLRHLDNNLLLLLLIGISTVLSFVPEVIYTYKKSRNSTTLKNQYKLLFFMNTDSQKKVPNNADFDRNQTKKEHLQE